MIKVSDISKEYNLEDNRFNRMLQTLGIKSRNPDKVYKAIDNISFNIERGETVGIIGGNGAGKSTLLQIICGTLKPTRGTVVRPSKIAALLELGAGFNPEFTGRENVYLNGSLIGMTKKEINEKFDEILEFSGIGSFIEQPVKTYSSGMFARLAFSVAVHSEPELLIVDEALSVGDTSFQEKSINKMKELRDSGMPIFFVSHSIPMVRNFCTRAIWLQDGTIRMDAEARVVCQGYLDNLKHNNGNDTFEMKSQTPTEPSITIAKYTISHQKIYSLDDLKVNISLKMHKEVRTGFGIGILIHDNNGKINSVISTVRDDIEINSLPEDIVLDLKNIPLLPGKYSISISITDELSTFHYDRLDHCLVFEVAEQYNKRGLPKNEGTSAVNHKWLMS
ncbi:ABC transporter ATP-binding protein [Vibrio cyclitrophicus]|nr:ABC transporter ATP-binding protein [Vibrio cyclitrophicus]